MEADKLSYDSIYLKQKIDSTLREHAEIEYADIQYQICKERDFVLSEGRFDTYDRTNNAFVRARFYGDSFGLVDVSSEDAVAYLKAKKGYSWKKIDGLSANEFSDELVDFGLWKVAGHKRHAETHGEVIDDTKSNLPPKKEEKYESAVEKDPFSDDLDGSKHIEYKLKKFARAASETGDDEVSVDGKSIYAALLNNQVFVSSAGSCIETKEAKSLLRLDALARTAGEGLDRYMGTAATMHYGSEGGYELLDSINTEYEGYSLGKRAISKKKAPHISERSLPKKFPVVLDGVSTGVLAHEAVGHMAEGDVANGHLGSPFKNRLHEKLFRDNITIVDDPTMKKGFGSYMCDSEGVMPAKTTIVDHGVLENYLTDMREAAYLGQVSNGHGRTKYATEFVVPRMSNTYLEPDKSGPGLEKLVETIDEGLFISNSCTGSVDPRSGDVRIEAQEAHIIRDGKIAEEVSGVVLRGNAFDLLNNVTVVGNETTFAMSPGYCGKPVRGRQHLIHVTTGGPAIKIDRSFALE